MYINLINNTANRSRILNDILLRGKATEMIKFFFDYLAGALGVFALVYLIIFFIIKRGLIKFLLIDPKKARHFSFFVAIFLFIFYALTFILYFYLNFVKYSGFNIIFGYISSKYVQNLWFLIWPVFLLLWSGVASIFLRFYVRVKDESGFIGSWCLLMAQRSFWLFTFMSVIILFLGEVILQNLGFMFFLLILFLDFIFIDLFVVGWYFAYRQEKAALKGLLYRINLIYPIIIFVFIFVLLKWLFYKLIVII